MGMHYLTFQSTPVSPMGIGECLAMNYGSFLYVLESLLSKVNELLSISGFPSFLLEGCYYFWATSLPRMVDCGIPREKE